VSHDRKIRSRKAKVTSSTSRKDRPAAIFHVLAATFKQIVGIYEAFSVRAPVFGPKRNS
jgi:hypothetical protein